MADKPECRITTYVEADIDERIRALQKERDWSQSQVTRWLLRYAITEMDAAQAAQANASSR